MLRLVVEHRVTHAFFVPAVVQMLIDQPGIAEADLSCLQVIAYGGAPMTEALLLRAMATLGCAFLGVYGMTETAGSVTSLAPQDHDPGGPRAGLLRSIGRPLPWHEVTVHDPLTGEPSPVGEVGEIWVRSGQNMPGYWHRPEETAADADRRRLAAHRRRRVLRRRRLPLPARPHQGHDHLRRGERLPGRGRERAGRATPPSPTSRSSACRHERWGETVKALVVPVAGTAAAPPRS